jgi:2'-5' RNA ligase
MKPAPGAVDTQRLFFALWPDADLQQRLAAASLALLPPHSGGRHVPPGNLHCTLLFLGAVDAAQRLCVEAAADRVRAAPFSLVLDRFGYFRRPQVAWLGCSATPSMLSRLVADLGAGCAACGFPPEHRPYAVHLTVARKVIRDPGRPAFMPVSWPVQQFALVESVTAEDGARYRPLRFWAL